MSRVLITGSSGFIGYHVSQHLLQKGIEVFGIDNINDYYEVKLKLDRLSNLKKHKNFHFFKFNIHEKENVIKIFSENKFQRVIHLAAQAGVRYSLSNPEAYITSNITGTLNILEACRHNDVEHLTYASSSSVYGCNTKLPFSTKDTTDHPISLYAATKKANELMAHTYSHLFKIPTTGLRFFTVYGPWGRPDMALFLFTKAILNNQPINIFNNGIMKRDFTYIDDIAEGVIRVSDQPPIENPLWDSSSPTPEASSAPYKIYNIGNNNPVELLYLIEILENCLGKKSKKIFLPMQAGDVPSTFADTKSLSTDIGFSPKTPIEIGIENFVRWYKNYYNA